MADHHYILLLLFAVIGLIVVVTTGHALVTYKIGFIHETGLCIILGLFGGSLWLLIGPKDAEDLGFSTDLFFEGVLPPIIFAAGYTLDGKAFFKNFSITMILGVFGTMMTFFIVSMIGVWLIRDGVLSATHTSKHIELDELEMWLFAALLSATDGVAVVSLIDAEAYPRVFGTLIGEGVINDGVAIILYASIMSVSDSAGGESGNFTWTGSSIGLMFVNVFRIGLLSLLVGVLSGLLSAYYFRHVRTRLDGKKELVLLILFAYLAYMTCEIFELSGIISVFFCGTTMSHYTWYSLSEEVQEGSQVAIEGLSYMGETFIYVSLGFYMFQYTNSSNWSLTFLIVTVTSLLVSRIFVVCTCVLIVNCLQLTATRIGWKEILIYWWGGNVRGSICFALALRTRTSHQPVLVTSTFTIVILTTFAIGSMTDTFLKAIQLNPTPLHARKQTFLAQSAVSRAVKRFDERWMIPYFGRRDIRLFDEDAKELLKSVTSGVLSQHGDSPFMSGREYQDSPESVWESHKSGSLRMHQTRGYGAAEVMSEGGNSSRTPGMMASATVHPVHTKRDIAEDRDSLAQIPPFDGTNLRAVQDETSKRRSFSADDTQLTKKIPASYGSVF